MEKLNTIYNWEELKAMILEAEPQLSPEDVDFTKEQQDELISRIAAKLNRSPDHIIGWIESVASNRTKAS